MNEGWALLGNVATLCFMLFVIGSALYVLLAYIFGNRN